MDQAMKYVYTVYQEGSFSKAAEKLFITQPALSIAIRKVESELKAVLFDRSQHPLKLTNVGQIYVQKYNEIKTLEKELNSQISDIHNLLTGELLIGGTHFILSYVLAQVLSDFSMRYPNIDIRLIERSSDKLDDLLLDGSIDLCLKCDDCAPSLKRIDFAFRDYLLIAMPKEFIIRFGLPDTGMTLDMIKNGDHLQSHAFLDFEYLRSIPFLVLTAGNNLRERFLRLFEEHGLTPYIRMQIEQIVTAYHLAERGMGATLTSAMIAKKSICDNLMFYTLDSPLMTRDFHVIGRNRRYVSDANSRFIELLKSHYDIDK